MKEQKLVVRFSFLSKENTEFEQAVEFSDWESVHDFRDKLRERNILVKSVDYVNDPVSALSFVDIMQKD